MNPAAADPSSPAGRAFARAFRPTDVPPDFVDDPYPYYACPREHEPVHEIAPGAFFFSRYDDVLAVYRDPRASSDKRREFRPKLGDGPIYEHHTTSLVFNDPPPHTRVRRLIMGALNQRAIARKEAGVIALARYPRIALAAPPERDRRVRFRGLRRLPVTLH